MRQPAAPPRAADPAIEITTFQPTAAAHTGADRPQLETTTRAPPPLRPASRPSSHARPRVETAQPVAPADDAASASGPVERSRTVDLFADDALRRAVGASPARPSDAGGHLRRSTDPPLPAVGEHETVTGRVREMVADAVGRERASSGNIAPRWREIERKLAQSFHPPLAVVKQENVVKAFAHQVLRSWLDGEPRVGTVVRGVDASVQTLPGTPEGLNLRSLPMEQALAVQARWGEPATWLRVEVEVTIDEDGRIVAARVTRPSGRRLFDRTALGAVEDAIRAGGVPEEHATVVTRWLVEAALAVSPPTSIGFRFDESGHLNPGATGVRKYLAPTYPLQQSVRSHVSLIAIER